jgi:hypothetical protein
MASKSKSTIPWKPEKTSHWSTACVTTSLFSAADLLKLPSLSRMQNLEGTTLIWFDSSINRNEEDRRLTQEELREINDYVVFHTEQQACIDCIKSITNERIFLVTSGRCASSILSQIEHFPQVLTVFIFCLHPKKYSNLTNDYKKIAGIYCEHQDLIYSIREVLHMQKNNWKCSVSTTNMERKPHVTCRKNQPNFFGFNYLSMLFYRCREMMLLNNRWFSSAVSITTVIRANYR